MTATDIRDMTDAEIRERMTRLKTVQTERSSAGEE